MMPDDPTHTHRQFPSSVQDQALNTLLAQDVRTLVGLCRRIVAVADSHASTSVTEPREYTDAVIALLQHEIAHAMNEIVGLTDHIDLG